MQQGHGDQRVRSTKKGMDQMTPGMTYGLTALSLAVYAIPLVLAAYHRNKPRMRLRATDSGEAISAARRNWVRANGKTMWTVVRTIIVALAVACCASARAQTLTGTASVTDADTIVIGGETIRLQGVDAPETDQICLDSRSALWNCGIDARDRLLRHIGSRETSCVTKGKDVFSRWL